jgi:hypothetical protein
MEQVVGTVLVVIGVLLIGWKAARPVGEAPEVPEVAEEVAEARGPGQG